MTRTDISNNNGARNLVLLGAFAALLLNKNLRRNVIEGTRNAFHNAHDLLDETLTELRPVITQAAQQAGETWSHLREEVPQRAQALIGEWQEQVGEVTDEVQKNAERTLKNAERQYMREYRPKLLAFGHEVQETAEQRAKRLQKGLLQTQRRAESTLHDVQENSQQWLSGVTQKVQELLHEAEDTLEGRKRQAQREIARARREIERELRQKHGTWNVHKLEREIEKRIAPVHKKVQRELALFERSWGKPKNEGLSGGTVALITGAAVLGTGFVVLARMPEVRQNLLDTIEDFSPETADQLESMGQSIHGMVGDFWVKRTTTRDPIRQPNSSFAQWEAKNEDVLEGSSEKSDSASMPEAKKPSDDLSKIN